MDPGSLELPCRLGEFAVEELRSASAVGAIYRAERGGRRWHVRVLDRSYTRDEEAVRIVHEAVGRAWVDHPNAGDGDRPGRGAGCGVVSGLVYFACSPANDVDLETVVRRGGPPSWREVRRILLHVCRGLDAAHRQGVVHGDVRAGHCFVHESSGLVRVTGFGLAAALRRAWQGDGGGAPSWVAPEQAAGAEPDVRGDVYGVGVLLHFLVAGELPRDAGRRAPDAYRTAVVGNGSVPSGLERVLERAMAEDPRRRFATIRELATELAGLGGRDAGAAMMFFDPPAWPPPPWHSRIDWRLVVAAVVVAVLFAIAVNGEWVLSAK